MAVVAALPVHLPTPPTISQSYNPKNINSSLSMAILNISSSLLALLFASTHPSPSTKREGQAGRHGSNHLS
jgi:hypothetical protein